MHTFYSQTRPSVVVFIHFLCSIILSLCVCACVSVYFSCFFILVIFSLFLRFLSIFINSLFLISPLFYLSVLLLCLHHSLFSSFIPLSPYISIIHCLSLTLFLTFLLSFFLVHYFFYLLPFYLFSYDFYILLSLSISLICSLNSLRIFRFYHLSS